MSVARVIFDLALFVLGGCTVAMVAGRMAWSAQQAAQSARRETKAMQAAVGEAVERLETMHCASRSALTAEHMAAVDTLTRLVRVEHDLEDRS